MNSKCETRCGGLAFTAAKIMRGKITSPDTGVGLAGGGEIVRRGEGGGFRSAGRWECSFSVYGSPGGASVSGDKTTVGES